MSEANKDLERATSTSNSRDRARPLAGRDARADLLWSFTGSCRIVESRNRNVPPPAMLR